MQEEEEELQEELQEEEEEEEAEEVEEEESVYSLTKSMQMCGSVRSTRSDVSDRCKPWIPSKDPKKVHTDFCRVHPSRQLVYHECGCWHDCCPWWEWCFGGRVQEECQVLKAPFAKFHFTLTFLCSFQLCRRLGKRLSERFIEERQSIDHDKAIAVAQEDSPTTRKDPGQRGDKHRTRSIDTSVYAW